MAKLNAADIASRAAAGLKPEPKGRGVAGFVPAKPGPSLDDAVLLPLNRIAENPNQPRKFFDPARMTDLENSIVERGLLQPIIVTPDGTDFMAVDGGRRLKAFLNLQKRMPEDPRWRSIPAIIRVYQSDNESAIDSVVANLQREDLTPLEEANAYDELIAAWGLNPDRANRELARRTGIHRSRIDRVRLVGRFPFLAAQVAVGAFKMVEAESIARDATQNGIEPGAEEQWLERTGILLSLPQIEASSDATTNSNLPQFEANLTASGTNLPQFEASSERPQAKLATRNRTPSNAWNSLWYAQRNILRLRQRVTPKVLAELPAVDRPAMLRTVDMAIQELLTLKSDIEATAAVAEENTEGGKF